ncbi:MAG TPA: hypothetical protein VF487_20345 [Chitinophagaceae bacterium]
MAHHKRQDNRTKEQQQTDFLLSFEETANISISCKASAVPRRTIYNWINDDADFKKKFDKSALMCLGVLEDEAMRRAVSGVKKPVYQGGKLVGHVQEYSDTLLIVLLKARSPEKYKERFVNEVTGKDGKDLIPSRFDNLSTEQIEKLLELSGDKI